jgi:Pyruvate phosphate dikinase, AMP/ATP-binding domain
MGLLDKSSRTLAHVIGPRAFQIFGNKGNSFELESVLDPLFQTYLSQGVVSIRPAYWSALNSGDNLPQSGRLTSLDQCKDELIALWDFIIEQQLDDYTAEVAAIVSNWLPVYASGVCLTAPRTDELIVHALYGFLEGLERYSHDSYVISLKDMRIVDSRIAKKSYAIVSPKRGPEDVPDERAAAPVLNQEELLEIASLIKRMVRNGEIRLEVLITAMRGAGSVIPWQIEQIGRAPDARALYRIQPYDSDPGTAVAFGPAVVLTTGSAVPPLRDLNTPVIIIGSGQNTTRDRQWIIDLAQKAKAARGVVSFEGSILSHFATTLREFGVQVYPVAGIDKRIRTGDQVAISPVST